MLSLSSTRSRPVLRIAALSCLTAWAAAAQEPAPAAEEPEPVEVAAPAAPGSAADAGQAPVDGPRVRPGEILDESAIGPVVIEDMAAVVARQAEQGYANGPNPKARNGAQGEWEVPGMRWNQRPHSGVKHAINRWGDTRMAIGFGREVDLVGAWIAGQGTFGSWTDGLQAIGYRDGEEVARSDWFEQIDGTPAWFAMGLEDVDRVVLVARPVIQGSGWYALDDLSFEVAGEDGAEQLVVLDFEDVDYGTRLTGSGYAGLDWEVGTGDFVQPAREVPPPQVPPGTDLAEESDGGAPDATKMAGAGTTPKFVRELSGPRFGDAGANLVPPDTCGAVGPTHFVAAVNANLSVYLKSTGQRVVNVSLSSFWGAGVGDPRVAYDDHHDRWVVIASDFSARVYFAYSLTGDPTGAWFKTSIFTPQGSDAGKWPDYPTLGVDANGIYTASYMVGGSNQMTVWSIDKAPLLAATPSMGTVSAWRLLPWEGAIQPCVTYGDSGGVYLISRRSSSTLRLRQITGPLTSPSLVERGNPVVPSHSSAPDATQKGTVARLSTIDYRPMNAVYRNGSVWTTHCIAFAGRAAVRWYEVDAATASALQVGTVSDASLHYYMPGISVNADDEMVVGFSGSDTNTYAGAWFTGRVPSDPPGETGPPLEYYPGVAPYTQLTSTGTNRWGDYSLTSIDPLDGSFWTIQEFAPNSGWATRIGVAEFACGVSTYCTPKPTSNLCVPTMTWSGEPVLQLPQGFQARVEFMDTSVNAIMFFGLSGPDAKPFQGGTLCVASPLWRLPGKSTGGTGPCGGTLGYTLAEFLASSGGAQIVAGSQVSCQAWARDKGDAFGTGLSDALVFEICP